MSDVIKKAIIKNADLEEIMVKTHADNVYVNSATTLASKLLDIVSGINARAKITDVDANMEAAKIELNAGISGVQSNVDKLQASQATFETTVGNTYATKSDLTSTNTDVANVQSNLDAYKTLVGDTYATKTDVTAEITAAVNDLINGAPDAYNTLQELATYISENDDAITALTEVIGTKASQADLDSAVAILNTLKAECEEFRNVTAATHATKSELTEVATDVANLEVELGGVKDSLSTTDNGLAAANTNIAGIQAELTTLKATVESKADADTVNTEIEALESDIADLNTRVDSLKTGGGNASLYMSTTIPEEFGSGDLLFQIDE